MTERIGWRPVGGAPDEGWVVEDEARVEAGVAELLWRAADEVEAAGGAGEAGGAGRSLEDELLAPSPEHAARPVDLGAVTEALRRVVAREPSLDEPAAEARMRKVAARYLELRLSVAAGVARISVG